MRTYLHTNVLYVCTCVYIRTYIHTCTHTYVRRRIPQATSTNLVSQPHTPYVCTYVHTYICTYVHTYICTYVHTYICTYVHMCICAYTLYVHYVCRRIAQALAKATSTDLVSQPHLPVAVCYTARLGPSLFCHLHTSDRSAVVHIELFGQTLK